MNIMDLRHELGVDSNNEFRIPSYLCGKFPTNGNSPEMRASVVYELRELRKNIMLWFDDKLYFAQEEESK